MKMDEVFPFGVHVYREPSVPFEEIAGDLRIARRLGFNMVKVQESWAMDEPNEGEIDLSRVERVIMEAKSLGLGVYLGLTMEQAPAWLWRKYPDCHPVYADGRPHNDPTQYLLPADGKPGPCWDHPGAREVAELFMADLARRLGRHDNIWVWNVWQEVGFGPHDGGVLGFCYCPYTLTRFREWLDRRYGELAALNAAWHTAFGQWKEVEPPRRHAAVPSSADWRYFMDDVCLARVLSWRGQSISSATATTPSGGVSTPSGTTPDRVPGRPSPPAPVSFTRCGTASLYAPTMPAAPAATRDRSGARSSRAAPSARA